MTDDTAVGVLHVIRNARMTPPVPLNPWETDRDSARAGTLFTFAGVTTTDGDGDFDCAETVWRVARRANTSFYGPLHLLFLSRGVPVERWSVTTFVTQDSWEGGSTTGSLERSHGLAALVRMAYAHALLHPPTVNRQSGDALTWAVYAGDSHQLHPAIEDAIEKQEATAKEWAHTNCARIRVETLLGR